MFFYGKENICLHDGLRLAIAPLHHVSDDAHGPFDFESKKWRQKPVKMVQRDATASGALWGQNGAKSGAFSLSVGRHFNDP